ncbi:beta-lactamase/transpeptidase-like protein [Achaetomium macrosporum]|uniref:Beta-lactamase/transpeptidase-like protein n=1 Tax=Achaetomium macrosporum TaxID=79813 RepID=A0AAN7CCB3_9PEZI|nr:beta-lactamase/transpeptidase-like protein [Achaetomium macrosporum]
MTKLSTRLDALRPKIEELMRIGRTPGLSLGVMHQGDQTYLASYGYRDVEQGLPPNDETILPVCSLTKAVISAALGILVDENKANWNTLVKDALPSLDIKDETLQNQMTIADLLCHRGKVSMAFLNRQTRLLPFRGQFAYNNLAYEIAGKVIESLSKESYSDFIQSRIFDPLGMTRTYLKTTPPDLDNVGKCYNALDDGTSVPIACVKHGDDWFGGPSGGMRTCVRELMKLYKAFVKGFNHEFSSGHTSTEGMPLKQVAQLMSAKIPMDQPSKYEASHGFGWARVQLPGRMGQIGINPGLMPDGMPIVGKGVAPRAVIFHQGTSERNDYLAAAKTSAATNLQWYPDLVTDLQQARKNGTSGRVFHTYAGTYWDSPHVIKIVVTAENDHIYWAFQGLESEKFRLTHYEDDTFIWLRTSYHGVADG